MTDGKGALKKEVLSFFQNEDSAAGELLDFGCDGIWCRDLSGANADWISTAFFRMLGHDPSEEGRPDVRVIDLIHPEDVDILNDKADSQNLYGAFSGENTVRYFHKDGSVVLTRCRFKILPADDGNPGRMLAVHQSITGSDRGSDFMETRMGPVQYSLGHSMEEEVSRLAGILLTTTDLEEISSAVLDTARSLTNSRFGFAGSVDQETGHFELHALTRDILKQGGGLTDHLAVFENRAGLWGWVLENRTSAMVNDPENDPRSTGTPEGHEPVKAFLGVPAMIGERVVGQIAIANPERRFTELDRTVVQRMATLYAMAIQRREYEAALLAAETRKSGELDRLVTERTAQLAKSSELFRKVFTGQLDAIFILDSSDPPAILDCNPAAESLFGYKSNEIAGRTIEFLHQGDTISNALDRIRFSGPGDGSAFHLDDVKMHDRTGTLISVTVGITTLLDNADQAFGFVLVVRDIREQKQYEQKLREALDRMQESEERMKLALDSVSDALWDIRMDSGETYFSSRWYTMLGYTPGELPASYETWRRLVHPDDLSYAEDMFRQHLDSGTPFETEFRMKSNDGSWRWLLARGKTVERDAHGNAVRMLGTHMDITDRKYMEERLQQSHKMEAIGTLAGGIAHDFNNILAAITGYTELVLHVPSKDTVRNTERLQGVIRAAERAQELIQQILTFSRAGEKRFESMDISPVVKEAIKFVRASLPSSVEIRTSVEEQSLYISGNATQIHQVIMNLSTNAAKAMPNGGTLSVSLSGVTLDDGFVSHFPNLSAGEFVKLSVADTGCGIRPRDLPRIFDPFFTTREKDQGTGMGLSLVHGIVKEHGGEVLVHSVVEEGTRFDVYFPAAARDAQEKKRGEERLLSGSEQVLMVDDEEVLSEIVQEMLVDMGYTVTVMNAGDEALELFKRNPEGFDILLTDVTMPGMTGIQLASECRRIRSDIPIILWSGNRSHVTGEEMQAAGISKLLQKPVKQADLGRAIREVLDGTA